jgi:hypothetical protein
MSLSIRHENYTLRRLLNQRSLQSKIHDGAAVLVAEVIVTQNLAPIYEQVGDAFSHAKDKVFVAKVDADGAGKPLGQKYGVSGFPSAWPSLASRLDKADSNSFEVVRRSRVCFRIRRWSGS